MQKQKTKALDAKTTLNKGLKNNALNADTIAAIHELKAGKGKKFKSVKDLFNSI